MLCIACMWKKYNSWDSCYSRKNTIETLSHVHGNHTHTRTFTKENDICRFCNLPWNSAKLLYKGGSLNIQVNYRLSKIVDREWNKQMIFTVRLFNLSFAFPYKTTTQIESRQEKYGLHLNFETNRQNVMI